MNDISQKQQYVYIGQYYHIKDKQLPIDLKFGVTDCLEQREYSLSRTKSPIKYMILDAWELPSIVKREQVESLIATIFDKEKYDGCEWYDVEELTFRDKIATLFNILTSMFKDDKITFKKVDLSATNKSATESILESKLESEIRERKRATWKNLSIQVDGVDVSGDSAKQGFINAIRSVINTQGELQVSIDFPSILKQSPNDFPEYKKPGCTKIKDLYLDTHSSSDFKRSLLKEIFEKYKINARVELS